MTTTARTSGPTTPGRAAAWCPGTCQTDPDANEYRVWYSFAVPGEWEPSGIVGGSSSPVDEGTTVKFGQGDACTSIELEGDARQADGTLSGGQGREWTSFDYTYSIGDDSVTVQFEEVATARIDGPPSRILTVTARSPPPRTTAGS